ncbi:GNAT family N-acetyltransferase [Barrientosiimonas endolithica]|uniref:GNAT family N-acetyltransferase n=1 Tax=Barrientosiimonas endolithica TaxID=1535208 RepID=UPI00259B8E58|nr:GNAT family N-acetyltransferase [Barrientosiimonas endolithica]
MGVLRRGRPVPRRSGDALRANPVEASVVATMAEREQREGAPDLPHRWFAVAGGDEITGIAMRTAPFVPYPPFLLAMPDELAVELADVLLGRGEPVEGVNGGLPAARVFAERVADATESTVRTVMHTRLFELTELTPPEPAEGSLRRVDPSDVDDLQQVTAWTAAFHRDADAQAGRGPGDSEPEAPMTEQRLRSLAARTWFWEVDGEVVHMTGLNPPAFGVARIGPVYTPPRWRGNGYAASTVAALSQQVLDAGDRVCLYTDQANPVSNALYERLGYHPVVDNVQLRM